MDERIIESSYNGIKVTVRIPLNVREDKKQNRINEIYDILTKHDPDDDENRDDKKSKKKFA